MKVVKLDNRHRAFKHGFSHACRFDKGETAGKYRKIVGYLEERHPKIPITDNGLPWPWKRVSFAPYADEWEIIIGDGAWQNRIIWICAKNEEMLTIALLSIDFS